MTAIPVITIDGPAASGKGTIAAGVARALDFHLLDSGALYRLVGLVALSRGLSLDDGAGLAAVAAGLDAVFEPDGSVRLGGRTVSGRLREEDVAVAASRVAVYPAVRQALHARQRAFLKAPGLVADGRDMGTVVFPEAPLKVFVTASLEERASRRHKQLIAKGISVTIESLLHELRARDERDTGRVAAPMKPAVDAMQLDTTNGTPADAVAVVLERWRKVSEGESAKGNEAGNE